MEKEQGKIKRSGGTKKQRIKEGTYEQVNSAYYKWLLIQRPETSQSMEQFYKKKPLVLQSS